MLKGFGNILVKELKELIRDPKILLGMILIPAILFPVLGGIMSFSIQSAREQAQKTPLLVLNNDGGYWSQVFIEDLNSSMALVFIVNNTTPEQAVTQNLLTQYNTTMFLEVPSGFTSNVTERLNGNLSIRGIVNFYQVFSGADPFASVGTGVFDGFVTQFNRRWAPDVMNNTKSVIIRGEIQKGVDPSMLAGVLISQAVVMPITILILLTYSMQIAATSVAMEKEEKTLETLLTLPTDRFAILLGKLSGSILVAAFGAVAYMIGFNFYMGSITSTIPGGANLNLAALGLVPSVFGYALLGLSLFVTLLSALALAVIMSAFAEDVRSAQSLVGYIYPLIFLPTFVLLYVDIGLLPLPLRILLYAIPFSHPILASKAVIIGDYWTAVWGIVYVAAFTVIVMYAASRLFATEKILTAKLKLRGLRRRKKPADEGLQ